MPKYFFTTLFSNKHGPAGPRNLSADPPPPVSAHHFDCSMWTVGDDALAAQGGGGAWVMLHNQAKGDQPYWWGSKWD